MTDNYTVYTYADDTCIVYKEYDPRRMQDDMDLLSDYFRINVLSLNTDKTKYMIIKSPRRSVQTSDIYINDCPIERVSEMCYLGLLIDESLTWSSHIEMLSRQISRHVGVSSDMS